MGQPLSKYFMSYQLSVHDYPKVCLFPLSDYRNFYGQNKFMPIIRTYMLRNNQWDFPGITKIHVAGNIYYTQQRPWGLKWRIWNDLFLDGHHTYVPSENDTKTIGKYFVTHLNPGKLNWDNHNIIFHTLIICWGDT